MRATGQRLVGARVRRQIACPPQADEVLLSGIGEVLMAWGFITGRWLHAGLICRVRDQCPKGNACLKSPSLVAQRRASRAKTSPVRAATTRLLACQW